MHTETEKEKAFSKPSWQKAMRNTFYFGIPILVAVFSVIFPIRAMLRQAMVGFTLVWFVAGSWLFSSPK
jgi:hypothetical protein